MLKTPNSWQPSAENSLRFVHKFLAQQFLTEGAKGVEEQPELSSLSPELHKAIKRGWMFAYSLLFGEQFVQVLAKHHRQTIKWHWNARHRICKGQRPWNDYYADFPIWSRGHMKSTVARRIAVMDAVVEAFYGRAGYCLYFSGTDSKTAKHATSILLLWQ